MALHFPLIVGVAPPGGEHPRPQEVVEYPLRTAVELRLDMQDAWKAVLDSPERLADRVLWLTDDFSEVIPQPLVIGTCRREQDGGRFSGTEQERLQVLKLCGKACDLVDVEAGVKAEVPSSKTIRSFHDFEGVPDDLEGLLQRLRGEGGAVFKIVGTAQCLADAITIRTFLKGKRDVAAFLMGEFGMPTRILGPAWGSALTYASLTGGELAPGMVDFRRLVNLYRAGMIKPGWEVYGVTGRRVAHSLSPALHNVAMSKLDNERVYLPLAAEDCEDFMAFAKALPVAGASVTAPFKQDVLKHCTKLDEAAEASQAVNTIVRLPDGGYRGKNADVAGFVNDAKALTGVTLWGRTALVLGAGGAARSVVHGLRSEGAKVFVWARRRGRADELAQALGATPVADPAQVNAKVDVLVNTTPCGMAGPHANESALPWHKLYPLLSHDALVYDLVYEPAVTPLLRHAAEAGFNAHNGLGMLRRQAALQAAAFGYAMETGLKEPQRAQRHVWLVGNRGAGKSSLARELALRLHRISVDIDARIELNTGTSIREIFESRGEDAFRGLERDAIEKAALAKPDAVIATGGGAVEAPRNVRLMRRSGVVIYLSAPPELLARRLAGDDRRPSLTGKAPAEEVAQVAARRKPLFEQAAHIVYAVTDQSARPQARAIADKLAEYGKA